MKDETIPDEAYKGPLISEAEFNKAFEQAMMTAKACPKPVWICHPFGNASQFPFAIYLGPTPWWRRFLSRVFMGAVWERIP